MKEFKKDPLFIKLFSLQLPSEDFAIFGSGPLYAHGLRETINDIDLITRRSAWDIISKNTVIDLKILSHKKVVLFDGDIEAFNNWGPGEWDIDELIDSAEKIDGIKFVTLQNVLKWKKMLQRPKDIFDIEKIEEYL